MAHTWLAMDIGTTDAKAALISADGRLRQSAYRDYPTHNADGGVVEQHAADWWRAVVESVRELRAADDTPVDAIAITGQMQDVILIDAQGNPTRPVILYSDTRARAEADDINARIGADRLQDLTGNTQGAGGLLAKLLWLQRHEPAALTRSAHLLFGAADYVAYQLTGTAVSDTTTASTAGLMNIDTLKLLAADLFAALDLAATLRLMPHIRPGGGLVGTLSAPIAQLLGLRSGTPVYHGPGDAGATTLGVGAGEPGMVYGYVGTSGWVAITSASRVRQDGLFTLAHPRAGHTILIAPLLTAGGNLDWARDLFGGEPHAAFIEAALSRPPSALLYLPYLNGERSPFNDPLARGALIGLNASHTRADVGRAVLEGVVYAYRHNLDALNAPATTGLRLTGGGTRSTAWCQLFADIFGLPVAVAEDAANVGVRGAVLAAQVASGTHATYAPVDAVPVAVELQPDTAHGGHYDRQYDLFRAAYPALRDIFAAQARSG